MIETPLRISEFESAFAAQVLAKKLDRLPVLSPRTLIVGIPSNVENWPGNRSYLSVMRVGKPGEAGSYILQLSHYSEVKVIEVTDRHKIPSVLGWSEPGTLNGLSIPGWHKVLNEDESISSAIDDLMITYSHHTVDAENFYFLASELGACPENRRILKQHSKNLHFISKTSEEKLTGAKDRFTNPENPQWIGISGDDWEDEIAYHPRFAVLTNHRGWPLALIDFESERFGQPKNLRLWDGKSFTDRSKLARFVCKESTVQRRNFEIISTTLVQKIWPMALKGNFR